MAHDDLIIVAQRWIATIAEWNKNQVPVTNDIVWQQRRSLLELADFIESIRGAFIHKEVECDTQSVLLSYLANILEQLSNLSGCLSDWHCTTAIIRSYLSLVDIPRDFECTRSTNNVSLTQLAKILSKSITTELLPSVADTLSCTGHTQNDLNLAVIAQCSRIIVGRLSQHVSSEMSSCNVCQPSQLVAVCYICLRLGRRVDVSELLTTALSHLCQFHAEHKDVEQLLACITNSLKGNYTNVCSEYLPYPCVVILWSNRLSSLESEVLDCVRWVKQTSVTSHADLLSRISYLIRACADHPSLHLAVFTLLRHLYVCSCGHSVVGWIISHISRAVASNGSSLTSFLSLLQNGSQCSTLARLLLLSPAGLSQQVCLRLISDVSQTVDAAAANGAVLNDIRWLLLQFSDWRQVALLLCFVCERTMVDRFARLFCWFHGISTDSSESKQVASIMTSLRALMNKASLSAADVDFASGCMGDQLPSVTQAKLLTKHLLMMFCIQSLGGAAVFRHVISRVCGDSSAEARLALSCCAETLRPIAELPVTWLRDVARRPVELAQLLASFIDEAERSSETSDETDQTVVGLNVAVVKQFVDVLNEVGYK